MDFSDGNHVRLSPVKPFILIDDLRGVGTAVACDASSISTEQLNRLVSLGAGPVHAIISAARAHAFNLEPMNRRAVSAPQPHTFALVSIEAREKVHSGISIADRWQSLRCLADNEAHPRLIVSPGHVFPICASASSFLVCADLPHAALHVTQQYYLTEKHQSAADPTVAYLELFDERGEPASEELARTIAIKEGFEVVSLKKLLTDLLEKSPLIRPAARTRIPVSGGNTVALYLFEDSVFTHTEHVAVVHLTDRIPPLSPGVSVDLPEIPFTAEEEVLVRVHRKDPISDIFGPRNGAEGRWYRGFEKIVESPAGVLLYLDSAVQNSSSPSAGAAQPLRDYAVGAQILRSLGVTRARILSDSSRIAPNSTIFGVHITAQQPLSSNVAGS